MPPDVVCRNSFKLRRATWAAFGFRILDCRFLQGDRSRGHGGGLMASGSGVFGNSFGTACQQHEVCRFLHVVRIAPTGPTIDFNSLKRLRSL